MRMDDGSHRENGRSRAEQYKAAQSQWLMQHHQPTMKQIMTIMAERDAAIQERNLAVSEKKTAMAERDMAILQRDKAINERNNAIMERDNALATLHYRETPVNGNNNGMSQSQIHTQFSPRGQIARGTKHMHHALHHDEDDDQQVDETLYNSIDLQITEDIPLSPVASESAKSRGNKRAKEPKSTSSSKKVQKNVKKVKKENDSLNKLIFGKSHEWKDERDLDNRSDDLGNGKKVIVSKSDWKGQDMELNLIIYDDTTMPPPVCSCTGVFRQCYKWGNGGWQSSCCTTSISQYPLPSVPNKRHARVGGRKMSGGAYNKLLTRLSQEGHDLSNQVDLKDNWAKHGTNRYITIK